MVGPDWQKTNKRIEKTKWVFREYFVEHREPHTDAWSVALSVVTTSQCRVKVVTVVTGTAECLLCVSTDVACRRSSLSSSSSSSSWWLSPFCRSPFAVRLLHLRCLPSLPPHPPVLVGTTFVIYLHNRQSRAMTTTSATKD